MTRPIVAVALACVGLSLPAGAVPAAADGAERQVPSVAVLPHRLASELTAAHTLGARQRAIMDLLQALHVSVYAGDGQRIVAGDARGVDDLYLYDFEVREMADGLGRHETFDVTDLAAALQTRLGLTYATPQNLRIVLSRAIRAASSDPTDPASLIPRIVRAIGLTRGAGSDIVASPGMRLDAVQYFLIEASFLGPLLRQGGLDDLRAARAAARLPARVATTARVRDVVAHQAIACPKAPEFEGSEEFDLGDAIFDWVVKKGAKAAVGARLSKEVLEQMEKLENGKEFLDSALGLLHGGLLAYSLSISPVGNEDTTAYGPARASEPHSGQPLKFQFLIYMRDEIPEEAINCLAMIGFKIPPKGPVKSVPVRWDVGGLAHHGTFAEGSPTKLVLSGTKTGSNGLASITFTPRDEMFPGLGFNEGSTGTVDGFFTPGVVGGTELPFHLQALLPFVAPKIEVIRWWLSYYNQAASFTYHSTVTDTASSPWAGYSDFAVDAATSLGAGDPLTTPPWATLTPRFPVFADMTETASGWGTLKGGIFCSGPGGTFPGTQVENDSIAAGVQGSMLLHDVLSPQGPVLELDETAPSEQAYSQITREGTYCISDPPTRSASYAWFGEHADGTQAGDCGWYCGSYDLTGWQNPARGDFLLRYSSTGPSGNGESSSSTTIELKSALK